MLVNINMQKEWSACLTRLSLPRVWRVKVGRVVAVVAVAVVVVDRWPGANGNAPIQVMSYGSIPYV